MTRPLSDAMAAAIAANTVRPALLYEATYASGTVRYWSGYGNLSWNGHTFTGVGDLIELAQVDETDDVKAQGVAVTVNGSSASNIALTLASVKPGLPGIVYLALFDAVGALVVDPEIIFRGRLDTAALDDGDPTAPVVKMSYEHELADLERARERRYTDAAQQALYPGDTGLRFIATLQDVEIYWGQV